MPQALYRKWRPQSWAEVVGQDHIIQTLCNAVRAGRVAHAYLFAGPRGTGKTTTARLLAKAANCLAADLAARPCNRCGPCQAVNDGRFLDLIEIDAASNTSVEDVRDLRDKINFSPNEGRYKVYIIDEVHMLSTAAFNALLKTLEEPPSHAIFILATTEVHKIPATVLSRCQRHEFRRVPVSTIVDYLRGKIQQEGLQAEEGVLELVARQATGSLRDAISLIDQLGSAGGRISLVQTQEVLGTAAALAVRQVIEAIIGVDAARGLTVINRALDSGADPRQFARQVVDYLRGLLLARMGNAHLLEVTPELREEMARHAQALTLTTLLGAIRAFNRAAVEGRAGWQPALPLELALVEVIEGQPGSPPQRPASITDRPEPFATRDASPNPTRSPTQDRQTQPPPHAAASPAASLNFQTVLDRWKDVLAAARKRDPLLQALLNSCRPLGLNAGVLVLGFASDLLREKMEKGHSLARAQEALQEVFGQRVEIRPALTSGAASPEKTEPAPGLLQENGMVATALRDLGAHVVDVRPVPPEEAP